jgi:hypothetical protein
MRREWRQFLDGLGNPLEFLHADEFERRYGLSGVALPAIFKRDGERLEMLAGADSINACRTLDDLKRLLLTDAKVRAPLPTSDHLSAPTAHP